MKKLTGGWDKAELAIPASSIGFDEPGLLFVLWGKANGRFETDRGAYRRWKAVFAELQ